MKGLLLPLLAAIALPTLVTSNGIKAGIAKAIKIASTASSGISNRFIFYQVFPSSHPGFDESPHVLVTLPFSGS